MAVVKQTPAQEKAAIKWMSEKYGLAASLITDPKNKDLYNLFKQAINEKWAEDTTGNSQSKFMAGLRATKWWKTQSDQWRQLEVQRVTDPKTYELRMKANREKFTRNAGALGANFSDHMRDTLINQGISEGWDEATLNQHMAGYIKADKQGNLAGQAGTLAEQLRGVAEANGVKFNNRFYADAARSVLQGQQADKDWERYIREQAATQYSGFADQIRAGVDLKTLAAGTVSAVASELEADPDQIGLHDSIVQKALTNVGEDGKPSTLPLWQIKQMARQDPRYRQTQQFQKSAADVGMSLLKAWGGVE